MAGVKIISPFTLPPFPVSICNVSSHSSPPILLLFHMNCIHPVLVSCQCCNWFQLFLSLFWNIAFITSVFSFRLFLFPSFSLSVFLLLLFSFLFFLSMFLLSFLYSIYCVFFIIKTCVSNSHISSLFVPLLFQCCMNSLHFFCPCFYILFII